MIGGDGPRTIADVKRSDSLARTIIAFAILGLLVLIAVAFSGIVVIRRLATEQALTEAKHLAGVSARVVERRVSNGLIAGEALSTGAVARVVGDAILHDPIVRVKIRPSLRIIYSKRRNSCG